MNHFFSEQTSLTHPYYDPDSQHVEGQNELSLAQPAHQDTLNIPESTELENSQLSPPPPVIQVGVGQDVNPYLERRENTALVIKDSIRLGLRKYNGYVSMRLWICAGVLYVFGVWCLMSDMLSANENKHRFAKNSLVTGWNIWHGGKSKLLRDTGADAGSLKRNVHHYLVSVKAAHENQHIIKAQVSA